MKLEMTLMGYSGAHAEETDSLKSLKWTISCQFPFEVEVEEIVCKGLRLCLCYLYCTLCISRGGLARLCGRLHQCIGSRGQEGYSNILQKIWECGGGVGERSPQEV
jgi:hypothetical protein